MPALGVQGDLSPWRTQGRAVKKERSRNSLIELPASFFYGRYIQKFSGLTEKGILHNIPAVKP